MDDIKHQNFNYSACTLGSECPLTPFSTGVSSFLAAGCLLSCDLALRRACLLAKGVLANSFEEAEAADGLVGVLLGGVLVVGVDLDDKGVLAVGVCGLDDGVVALISALTLAALASLSLLVLVGLGVNFILRAVGLGALPLVVGGLVSALGVVLVSGCRLLGALVVVLGAGADFGIG